MRAHGRHVALVTSLRAVAFDSIQTCLDLEPLRARLVQLGLRPADLELWFARSLRDGFACECAGRFQPFPPILAGTLRALLESRRLPAPDHDIGAVIEAFAELPLHPDVRPAFERVREAGLRLALLTNGSERATRKAFARAGLERMLDAVISVDEIGHFKPAAEVYLHAAKRLRVRPSRLALIATHQWDVQGAQRTGLRGGFVRRGEPLSPALLAPDAEGGSLVEVLDGLGVRAAAPRRRLARASALAGLAAAGAAVVALRRATA